MFAQDGLVKRFPAGYHPGERICVSHAAQTLHEIVCNGNMTLSAHIKHALPE
jgi:hypothetical protein